MAKIRIKGDTSGYIDITAPAVAGTQTLTLPTSGSLLTSASDSSDFPSAILTSTSVLDSDQIGTGAVSAGKLVSILDLSSKTVKIPVGSTAERPGSPTAGMIRFNTSLNVYEIYGGSRWEVMTTGQAPRLASNPSLVTSTTNTTFRNMWTFTHYINSGQPKIISFGFTGWNNSGAYYWGWRLYNSTKSAVVPLLDVSPTVSNYVSSGGGIGFQGNVHGASAQPFVTFDMSGADNEDTIAFQMTNSVSGNASNPIASTQQLNAQSMKVFKGVVTGFSGTSYVGT